jgi:hypothetical protein
MTLNFQVGKSIAGRIQWERVPGVVMFYLLLGTLKEGERNHK